MMQVVSRAEWGARPPKWRDSIRTSKGVFLHYNGGSNLPADVVAGDCDAVCAHLRGVQNYHMNTQGWPDIAYSFCADATGRIYELRGFGVAGAHTLGWNDRSHAIYLPLGGDQAPTDAQVAAANQVIFEHDRRFGAGFVKGHQQAPNSTSCPGAPTMARILAGDFHATQPLPPTPPPDPKDDDMRFVVQDPRPGRSIWLCSGTLRRRLENMEQVNAQLFFGAEMVKADDPNAADSILAFLRSFHDVATLKVK